MVSTVETRYGRMQVPDVGRDIIGRHLFRYGEWADLELRFIAGNISDNANVADIGAFVGTFGIGLSHLRKLRGVCFVEGNLEVLSCLRQNVTSNCKTNGTVIDSFLFPNDTVFRAGHIDPANLGSLSFAVRSETDGLIGITAPKQHETFRQLNSRFGSFDFVKLDIEGLELAVLEEEKDLLTKGGMAIWAECNENIASLDLVDLLLSCQLNVYFFAFPSFNRDNFFRNSDPIFPFAYEAGLFATSGDAHCEPSLTKLGCFFEPIKDREALRRALWKTPRWVPREWICAHPEQTLAIAIHQLKADNYATFLVTGGDHEKPWPDIETSAFEQAHALERAQLQAELDTAYGQLETAQEALAVERSTAQNKLALEKVRCELLNSELLAAREAIKYNQTLLDHRTLLLQAMEKSISWRAARRAQRLLACIPGATPFFRNILRLIYRS